MKSRYIGIPHSDVPRGGLRTDIDVTLDLLFTDVINAMRTTKGVDHIKTQFDVTSLGSMVVDFRLFLGDDFGRYSAELYWTPGCVQCMVCRFDDTDDTIWADTETPFGLNASPIDIARRIVEIAESIKLPECEPA